MPFNSEQFESRQRNSTKYTHKRVADAEYRIRKMRNKLAYMVVEYYQGERVALADNNLSLSDAHTLGHKLANRTSF